MGRKFLKKKSVKFTLTVVFIMVLLVGIRAASMTERNKITQVEVILRDAIAPLYSGAMGVSRTISNIGNSITSYNDLLEENSNLREEVRQLALQNIQMEEYRQENLRLAKLLEFKEIQQDSLNLLAAKVIGRDLNNQFETIIIDRGSNDGIEVNMSVINHQGLVGRVVAVSKNTAEVLLLIDRESAVGALVQSSRTPGVVEATTSGNYQLQMIHLTYDAPIDVGDVLITSGLGRIFPKGIKIGYVADINMASNGLVKEAMVIPFVEFSKLEEVMVIMKVKKLPLELEMGEGDDQ